MGEDTTASATDSSRLPQLQYSHPITVLVCFAGGALIVLAMAKNVQVFVLFCRSAHLRSESNVYIISLTVANMLMVGFSVPLEIQADVMRDRYFFGGETLCKFWYCVFFVHSCMAPISILLYSIDKYRRIFFSFHYKRYESMWRAILLMALCWLLISMYSVVVWLYATGKVSDNCCDCSYQSRQFPMYGPMQVAVFATTVLTICINFSIFVNLRRRTRDLLRMQRHGHGARWRQSLNEISRQKALHFDMKNAINLWKLVISFILIWLPLQVAYLTELTCECVPVSVINILIWIQYADALVNPFLYGFTSARRRPVGADSKLGERKKHLQALFLY